MISPTVHKSSASTPGNDPDELQQVIERAARYLPAQRPITSFVPQNPLQAFEDQPFNEAVRRAVQMYRAQPYPSEEYFHECLERGTIDLEDVRDVLLEDLGEEADRLVSVFGTRFHLREAMLQYRLGTSSATELRWLAAESDALRRFRPDLPAGTRQQLLADTRRWILRDLSLGSSGSLQPAGHSQQPHQQDQHRSAGVDAAQQKLLQDLLQRFGQADVERWSEAVWERVCLNLLWRICHQGMHSLPADEHPWSAPVRHRDLLLELTGQDLDLMVNELLIRYCGAFVDQGFATWKLPEKGRGFWHAFITLYSRPAFSQPSWMRDVPNYLQAELQAGRTPLESIAHSLDELGVPAEISEEYLLRTLLALPGWAGMLWQLETGHEWTQNPLPAGTLIEYLAIRLLLERAAIAWITQQFPSALNKATLRYSQWRSHARKRTPPNIDQRTFHVFQLVQIAGWPPESLSRMSREQWKVLIHEIEQFGSLERRRIYHAALERRYFREALDAIATYQSQRPPVGRQPAFQVVCCLDDREESFRRHLEELAPDCETFGTAGFFGVAMKYQGLGEAGFRPLCPVVVTPRHYVKEEVLLSVERLHLQRTSWRRQLGSALHQWESGSRTMLGGVVTGLLGSVTSVPLVMSVLFPRISARIRQRFGRFIAPQLATQLRLYRIGAAPGSDESGLGYSFEEMAAIVERVLRETGLAKRLSRLVCIVGHGSSSFNNPHESAYNCGACGGGRGGPNARAFAQMANDPRVRSRLQQRGYDIPEETWFLGGYHNTCTDGIEWYDLDALPASHRPDFFSAANVIDHARKLNAQERCRRFESAPLNISPDDALLHVEQRAEDLSEVRPEYTHVTPALCIVGRRSRTRGLYLDRQAFLASYDPTLDDEQHSVLLQALSAVVPVCSGINLQYYFSAVDPSGYGCGSKLPLNITSLLGVMEGAASDLRCGLSQQMTEINQPLRVQFLIESTPAALLSIMARNETIRRLVVNSWVRIATLDPDSGAIQVFSDGRFEPYVPVNTTLPVVNRSEEWYRGWRGPLGIAAIRPAVNAEAGQ